MQKYAGAFGLLDRNGDAGIDLSEFQTAADDGTLLAVASRLGAGSSAFVVATVNAVSASPEKLKSSAALLCAYIRPTKLCSTSPSFGFQL